MSNLSGFVKRIRDIMRNDAGINGDAQRIEQIAWMLFLKVYDAKEQDWEMDEDDYESIIPEPCRWSSWAHDESGKGLTGDRLLNFVNNTLFPTLKTLPVTAQTPIKKAIVQTTFADANNYMKDGVLLRQVVNTIDELDLGDYEESHAFGEIYESILRELQSAGSSGEFYTPRAVTDFMAKMIQPKIGQQMADFACGTGGFLTSWLKALQPQIRTAADSEAYSSSIYGIEKKQFPYMLCITNMLLHDIDVPKVYHDNSLLKDVLDYTEDDQFDVILMNPPYGGSEKADVKNHFPSDLASSETADLFMSVIMYRLKKNGRAAVILPDGFLFGTDNAKVSIKKKLLKEFNLHTVIRMPGSVFAPYTSITTNILFFDRTRPTQDVWFYRLDMPEGYKHFSKTKPMKLEHFAPVEDWWNDRQEITVDGFDKAKKFTVRQLTEELGYNLDQCGYPHEEEEILDPMDLIQRYQEERASLNAVVDSALNMIVNGIANGVSPVPSSTISGALGRLTEIDRKFPDDMQKSLLQMAIQGKLVEQRPEEGTGEELFRQIQAEKQALIKNGKIKKEKPYSTSTSFQEYPFDIPDSWQFVRFGELMISRDSERIPVSTSDRAHRDKIYDYYGASGVIDKIDNYLFDKELLLIGEDGANLLSRSTPIAFLASGKYWVNNHAHVLDACSGLYLKYVCYYINAISLAPYVTGTAQPKMNQENMNAIWVALPPLAEQKRIVAKLEELLPLCERLK